MGALTYLQERVRPIAESDLYCDTGTGALIAPLVAGGDRYFYGVEQTAGR